MCQRSNSSIGKILRNRDNKFFVYLAAIIWNSLNGKILRNAMIKCLFITCTVNTSRGLISVSKQMDQLIMLWRRQFGAQSKHDKTPEYDKAIPLALALTCWITEWWKIWDRSQEVFPTLICQVRHLHWFWMGWNVNRLY